MASVLTGVITGAGCGYTAVRDQCPSCVVFSRHQPPAAIPDGTRTVILLVPGILGFGWEWDEAIARLRREPRAAVQVFDWPMSSSLGAAARDFAHRTNQVLARLPPSVETVVVFGHSAGGMVTAYGADRIVVPPGITFHVVNFGAPYAGMQTAWVECPDMVWAPMLISLGGSFSRYPRPARGVTVESFMTSFPGDPVMEPHFGHDPGDPHVGPPGHRHTLPPGTDHNRALAEVVSVVLNRAKSGASSPALEAGP